MAKAVRPIALDKLAAHPDNPNEMSKVNFAKLVRNIERTGRYEPLIVRPSPEKRGYYQIINGYHRCHALTKLGYETADCIVWDIDDEQTDIFLATLNRLGGTDELSKKLKLFGRLKRRMETTELAKLLPQTAKQIERLSSMVDTRFPRLRSGQDSMLDSCRTQMQGSKSKVFANPLVFFVNDRQQEIIEEAISSAPEGQAEISKAARRAAALAHIAEYFLGQLKTNSGI